MHLNAEKVQLWKDRVPFIGHVVSENGLRVDPAKVKAIVNMPAPLDVAGVQRLLGMAQYLTKFVAHLSDVYKPLRYETEWA